LVNGQRIMNINETGVTAIDISDDGTMIVLGKNDGNLVFLEKFSGAEDFKRKEIIKVKIVHSSIFEEKNSHIKILSLKLFYVQI